MGLARADAAMRRCVDTGQVAGVATAVVAEGVLTERCYGFLDAQRRSPMQPDSLMRIYSLTKPVVAAAVLALRDEGLLSTADPVRYWLPSFSDIRVADDPSQEPKLLATDITIRHLLTHTAGLAYGWQAGASEERCRAAGLLTELLTLAQPLPTTVALLAQQPLGFQPGTHWHYSLSFDVLGHIVELVSGRSLGDFLHERIFAPLGMVDTGFSVPAAKLSRFGPMYGPARAGALPVVDGVSGSPYTDRFVTPSGGGGLVSTLRDYLRFARMLAGGGRYGAVRILQAQTVEGMATNQLRGAEFPVRWDEGPDKAMGYGFGLGVSAEPPLRVGWLGASGCQMWIYSDPSLVALAFTQSFFDPTASDAFLDALLSPD